MMCVNPMFVKKVMQYVPCGRCGNCVKRWISDWTIRCKVEARESSRAFFLTLTYAEDPLQLYKRDLQNFFKRCRKVGWKFSYFAVGDYGDTYGRPHYHVLLFDKGMIVPDYIWSLWISGDQTRKRGFVHIRPLTLGRIGYVVRYGYLAKLDYRKDGRTRPFFLMSRRPAIGASYLSAQVKAWHKKGNWYYADGQFKKCLPRYYRGKIFTRIDIDLNRRKFEQEEVERFEAEVRRLSYTSSRPEYDYYDRLINQAHNYLSGLRKQKKLKNKLL